MRHVMEEIKDDLEQEAHRNPENHMGLCREYNPFLNQYVGKGFDRGRTKEMEMKFAGIGFARNGRRKGRFMPCYVLYEL